MRRLNSTEKWALVLAGLMMLGGVAMTVFPSKDEVFHPASGRFGIYSWTEDVSVERARVYGVLSAMLGIGIAWLALRQDKAGQ